MALFIDRTDAGRELATFLEKYAGRDDVVVLGLPRGGVPVAYEVASALRAPLDVFMVRKLGVPGHEELAMGAIGSGGVRVLNRQVLEQLGLGEEDVERVAQRERRELERRERAYRGGRPPLDVAGKTAILIDDGLATGASMRAAVEALRAEGPAQIVVAVPTAARETCASFEPHVDEVVCAVTPQPFYAVGASYAEFSQTTDEEVTALLARAAQTRAADSPPAEDHASA